MLAHKKIDGSVVKIYNITIVRILIQDKLGKIRFFKETFLLAYNNMDVVLGMLFLFLTNVDVKFSI